MKRALISALMFATGCATSPAPSSHDPLALIERVADWQLAHMDDFSYVRTHREDTVEPRGWVQGAFFIGLTRLADISRDPHYAAAIEAHGQGQSWALGPRRDHADDHVIGQTWLWASRRTQRGEAIEPMRRTFDAILADPPQSSLEFAEAPAEPCTRRWCWCDALFMAPPAWFGLSAATGDPRYFAHADAEYWRVVDYLYDPEERLFFRDSRYFSQRSAQGRKIFWSRGNGWVFAGLALLLEYTPPEKAQRFRGLFVEMSARIAELQTPSGYWPPSLLEPEGAPPETSGTGFFVFGLAWGVNNGLLDRTRYSPAIERGWTALSRAVHPDGKLGWVQQVGSGPDDVEADMTQLYGVGALLLAGAEVHRMRDSRSAAP